MPKQEAAATRKDPALGASSAPQDAEVVAPDATVPDTAEQVPLDREDDPVVEEDKVISPPPEPSDHHNVTYKRY